MIRTIIILFMLMLAPGPAHAQGGGTAAKAGSADRAAIEAQLIANEHAINDAFARGDAKAFYELVDRNGPGINTRGVSKAADIETLLPTARLSSWKMDDTHVLWIDANTAVVYYRLTASGTFAGRTLESRVYTTSVWRKTAGKWMAVFHQETPLAEPVK
jgi:hypothetical protein